MRPEEILNGQDNLLSYFTSKGYLVNSSYVDEERPNAKFVNVADGELLAIDECKTEEELRTTKSHFLIDRGLTHCALVNHERVFFYRNYGEIRYFTYSQRTAAYKSKIDKLKRIDEGIDILFQLKDLSNDFYETFKQKRNLLVRAIRAKADDTKKYLISQRVFDRIFFVYFLCHRGLVKFQDGHTVSGATLFRIMLENGNFVGNLYGLFDAFSSEHQRTINVGEYSFRLPFLNGGLFRLDPEEVSLQVSLQRTQWQSIFEFLDSYHWIIEDDVEEIEHEKILTPEILGHVYERSVVEWEKKGCQEEVAEASGKTERKVKGVYYTPEAVTDFICKNTIYPTLLSRLPKKFRNVGELLTKGTRDDYEAALGVLNSMKILDPACGSGAFLIKAADIVFQLRSNLSSRLGTKPDHYQIKLETITNNVYGVDILEGATEIAKLRLWLWLVSSYSERDEITPLPNIEYNVVVGNSLVGWTNEKFGATLGVPLTESVGKAIEQLRGNSGVNARRLATAKELLESYELKDYVIAYSILDDIYKHSHGEFASALKGTLNEIRNSVYKSIDQAFLNFAKALAKKNGVSLPALNTITFHWGYDFGDIIRAGGFDVVIGNPPYVRVESLDHVVADFLKIKYESVHERCDLYIPFIQKFYELVSPTGAIGLIVQNQFFISEYGTKLRGLILRDYGIGRILDFTNYTPFHEVSTYSCIIVGSRRKQAKPVVSSLTSKKAVRYWEDRRFAEPIKHKDIETFEVDLSAMGENEWILRSEFDLRILSTIREGSDSSLSDDRISVASPLVSGRDEILLGQLLEESKGMYNLRFANGKSEWLEKNVWKPLLRQANIKKWNVTSPTEFVFFPYAEDEGEFRLISERDFKREYPKTYGLLSKSREVLLERRDSRVTWREKGLPWYTLHRLGVPENHIPGKIVTGTIINGPNFAVDSIGYLTPHGGVCGITSSKVDTYFLLGYLNSSVAYFYLKAKAPPKQNNYISLDVGLVKSLPFPLQADNAAEVSKLAREIVRLDAYEDPSNQKKKTKLEAELNAQIYSIFGFSNEQISRNEKRIAP